MNIFRSLIIRRILAAIVGLFTMCFVIIWTVNGDELINYFGFYRINGLAIGPDADPQAGTGPTNGVMEDSVFGFYLFLLGALVLASGGVVALIILKGQLSFKIRLWIYLLFLLIILPASLYNYGHRAGDLALKAQYQVILNLFLIFLGTIICSGLSGWKVVSPDIRVLKIMIFSCLIFSSILVPSLLTLLWTLWRLNIISGKTINETVKIETITALAGVASVIITLLKYFQEQRAT